MDKTSLGIQANENSEIIFFRSEQKSNNNYDQNDTKLTSRQEDSQRMKNLSPQEIHFTQATISENFADGTLVATLTKQLINGEIKPSQIAAIRVVFRHGKWWTLDNRRLRAFKDAFVAQIPVILCDFNSSAIRQEFHNKKTNKFSASEKGGVLRMPLISSQHFDGGIFTFTKRVLNWTIEQLAAPSANLLRLPPLSTQNDNAADYYAKFLELILEETRASLLAGIEEANLKKELYPLTLKRFKQAKNAQNPTTILFYKPFNTLLATKAYDAFLLEYSQEQIPVCLLAFISNTPTEESDCLSLKIVVDENVVVLSPQAFEEKAVWNAKPIGSVVTQVRMYDACVTSPSVSWLQQLITGQIAPLLPTDNTLIREINELDAKEQGQSCLIHLNESQQKVIQHFIALKEGLQLVQGPPGTGKTTTIVTLLKVLVENNTRTLVCAPSNKAVHVLADRFAFDHPTVPMILAGVEEKIADDNVRLKSIFLHTWGNLKEKRLRWMVEQLWLLTPEQLFCGTKKEVTHKLVAAKTVLKNLHKEFNTLVLEFKKFSFDFLTSEETNRFTEIMTQFTGLITENAATTTLLTHYFHTHKELVAKEHPTLDTAFINYFIQLRHLLNELTTLLNRLIAPIQQLMLNDSITGLEGQLLTEAKVVFATLSVSGRRLMKELSFDNLIVDEAGQAVEAETLIPLMANPRKVLLIGDPQQLPATMLSPAAVKLGFDRSLLWRLLKDLQQPFTLLTTQYRMHPAIREWPSRKYYEDKLKDDPSVTDEKRSLPLLKNAPPYLAPYAFINIAGPENNDGYSYKNKKEAECVVLLVQQLQKEFHVDPKQIVVITFYKGQMNSIAEKLYDSYLDTEVHTVDSFQGDESDIVIISFVRANAQGKVGFLRDFRRLNVALTRARLSVIMLGNAETLEQEKDHMAPLIENARQRKTFFEHAAIKGQLKRPIQQSLQSIALSSSSTLSFHKVSVALNKSSTRLLESKQNDQSNQATKNILPKIKPESNPAHPITASAPPQRKIIVNKPKTLWVPALHKKSKNISATASLTKLPLCRFFDGKPGSCKKNEACKFSHSLNETSKSRLR